MGFNIPNDITKQTALYMSSPLQGHLEVMVKDFDDFALQVRFLRLHNNFFNTVLYESNHADYQGVAKRS